MFKKVIDKKVEHFDIAPGTKFVDIQAFDECVNIKSINIPSSVINVGNSSWSHIPDCLEHLVEVVDNVKYLGPILIGVTDKTLSTYNIKEGTRYILEYAFYECSNLVEISLPSTLVSIGNLAFSGTRLTNIHIPRAVSFIALNSFIDGQLLDKITVDPLNQYYDSRMDCNAIIVSSRNKILRGCKNTVIPNGIESFGGSSFYEVIFSKDFEIPNSVKYIDAAALFRFYAPSIYMPTSVKEIGPYIGFDKNIGKMTDCYYENYNSICSMSIGWMNCLENGRLFIAGKEIKDVVITSGISSIGIGTFLRRLLSGSITIPSSVNYIGYNSFVGCSFEEIECYATIPPIISSGTFLDVDKSYPLYVPASSIEAYKNAEGWKEFTNILPISVDVTDGDEYENTKEESNQIINYTRTFTNTNWQAIYVPFSMNYADWSKDFEVARINDAHQWDDDDDGIIDRTQLEVIKIKSGWTEPNTPYLIRAKSVGEKVITVKDATLYKTEENTFDVTSWNTKFSFTGTYKTISGTDMKANGYYAMSNGKLVQAASTSSDLKPFRWYLDVTDRDGNKKNVNEVKIYVFGDDEDFETDVDLATENGKKDENVFDLSGRKVINAKAGIYVKNGKKYVVK